MTNSEFSAREVRNAIDYLTYFEAGEIHTISEETAIKLLQYRKRYKTEGASCFVKMTEEDFAFFCSTFVFIPYKKRGHQKDAKGAGFLMFNCEQKEANRILVNSWNDNSRLSPLIFVDFWKGRQCGMSTLTLAFAMYLSLDDKMYYNGNFGFICHESSWKERQIKLIHSMASLRLKRYMYWLRTGRPFTTKEAMQQSELQDEHLSFERYGDNYIEQEEGIGEDFRKKPRKKTFSQKEIEITEEGLKRAWLYPDDEHRVALTKWYFPRTQGNLGIVTMFNGACYRIIPQNDQSANRAKGIGVNFCFLVCTEAPHYKSAFVNALIVGMDGKCYVIIETTVKGMRGLAGETMKASGLLYKKDANGMDTRIRNILNKVHYSHTETDNGHDIVFFGCFFGETNKIYAVEGDKTQYKLTKTPVRLALQDRAIDIDKMEREEPERLRWLEAKFSTWSSGQDRDGRIPKEFFHEFPITLNDCFADVEDDEQSYFSMWDLTRASNPTPELPTNAFQGNQAKSTNKNYLIFGIDLGTGVTSKTAIACFDGYYNPMDELFYGSIVSLHSFLRPQTADNRCTEEDMVHETMHIISRECIRLKKPAVAINIDGNVSHASTTQASIERKIPMFANVIGYPSVNMIDFSNKDGSLTSHNRYAKNTVAPRFSSNRERCYDKFNRCLQQGTLKLPNDEILLEELKNLRKVYSEKNQCYVPESKDMFIKRMGSRGSPDSSDACVYTIAMEHYNTYTSNNYSEKVPLTFICKNFCN